MKHGFIMSYLYDMPYGIGLSFSEIMILSTLEGSNNTIRPSKHILEDIAKQRNVPYSTLTKGKDALVRDKIMLPLDRGVYLVNPYLFTKSSAKGSRLVALKRQWDDLKFKYVEAENAKKDAEIEKLKFALKVEVGGAGVMKQVDDLLGRGNNA